MRIITRKRLKEFWEVYVDSEEPLRKWEVTTKKASWKKPDDIVFTFNTADPGVDVDSGNKVAVFNIAGNKYRLVAAIHYNTGMVYVLKIMTHKEYSGNRWKREL
jgi:mRNA interferase HigB